MIQILYYSNTNQHHQVEAFLKQTNYTYRVVNPMHASNTIYDLLTQKSNAPSNEAMPEIDLLLFHDIDDEKIKDISLQLQKQELHIPYKAVVTETNKYWTLSQLLHEIMEEHAFFQSYQDLHKQIIELAQYNKDDYDEASWIPYQQLCVQGYQLLQEKTQPSKNLIDMMIQMIEKAKLELKKK